MSVVLTPQSHSTTQTQLNAQQVFVIGDAAESLNSLPPTEIHVGAGEKIEMVTLLLSGADLNMTAILDGEGAEYVHHVLYLGDEKDLINIETYTRHRAPHTNATMIVHGIAAGRSQITVTGNIFIERGGKHTQAHLEHEGLLMSRRSRITALPGFEIHTDDVRAAHSSAVHYIRPEQLFYLGTRGIDADTARRMIVEGFAEAMLHEIADETIRTQAQQHVAKKLARMEITQS
jgi:Fe-S cluster assembly protein SufD